MSRTACVRACVRRRVGRAFVWYDCSSIMQRGGGAPSDKLIRIAIVDDAKCKPKKCAQECKKSCPVVRMGTLQCDSFL